ncbi:MAG: trigger factor [Desulfobacteraceae bacterium]|nr:trigger factor [Desulfobacteraceae bacterium]
MKVTVEDQSSVKKVLHIEVPKEKVVQEIDDAYKSIRKTAKIKGFRPGKAPRSVLVQRFGKDVKGDVTSKLIQEAFIEALKETQLKMVGNPNVDPPDLSETDDYKFDATIEVNPEIADIEFKGLELKKNLYSAGDEEVDAQLTMLQKKLAKQTPLEDDRPAQTGDFVLIDYEGFKDGEPFAETQKTENFTLKLGDAMITETFDEALLGMTGNTDKEFTIEFPKDHFNSKLAGHTILFKAHLNEIREEVLPAIDDEFAKQLGPFATLKELNDKILENLTQGYDKRSEQELNEQIFRQLLDKTEFEVPESLVDMELDGIIREAEASFANSNTSLEDLGISREGLSEKYRDTAEKQVRRHLILSKLIEQEKMEVADDALNAGFQEIADAYQQPVENIKKFYETDKQKLELFKHTLLEKQAIKLIIDNSKIEEIIPEKEPQAKDS